MLLTNFRLIDGTGRPARTGLSMMIRDGRIVAVDSDLNVPGEDRLDLGGRTLMPGLIDLHLHLGGGIEFTDPGLRGDAALYDRKCAALLDWGVTTVRSGGDYETALLAYRAALKRGAPRAPRLFVPGRIFQAPQGHPVYTVWGGDAETAAEAPFLISDPEQADAEVARQAALGVDHIKAFLCELDIMHYPARVPKLSYLALEAIVESAHRRGLKVMVHCDTPDDGVTALLSGADTVEHLINSGCAVEPLPKPLKDLFLQTGAWYIPTLAIRDRLDALNPTAPVMDYLLETVGTLYRAGVNIAVGTDSGVNGVPAGESTHRELELLVQAGIPPLEVLRMATERGAKVLGRSEFGTVALSKVADLIAVDGDPATNISDTRNVDLVLREGVVLRNKL